jgi:hypothetical protein
VDIRPYYCEDVGSPYSATCFQVLANQFFTNIGVNINQFYDYNLKILTEKGIIQDGQFKAKDFRIEWQDYAKYLLNILMCLNVKLHLDDNDINEILKEKDLVDKLVEKGKQIGETNYSFCDIFAYGRHASIYVYGKNRQKLSKWETYTQSKLECLELFGVSNLSEIENISIAQRVRELEESKKNIIDVDELYHINEIIEALEGIIKETDFKEKVKRLDNNLTQLEEKLTTYEETSFDKELLKLIKI